MLLAVIIVIFSPIYATVCVPLKFKDKILVGSRKQNVIDCQAEEGEYQTVWNSDNQKRWCTVWNDCSTLKGPVNVKYRLDNKSVNIKTVNVNISNGATLMANLDDWTVPIDCKYLDCYVKKLYYTSDVIFVDEIQMNEKQASIRCSDSDGRAIIWRVNKNESVRKMAYQYPPSGSVARISNSPSFGCFFSGVANNQIAYRNVKNTSGQEGLWECSHGDRKASYEYSHYDVVMNTPLEDCFVSLGGSCTFYCDMKLWLTGEKAETIEWMINGEIIHKWNGFNEITFTKLIKQASIQCTGNFSFRNITATSSARINILYKLSVFEKSPSPRSFPINGHTVLQCAILVHPLLVSQLNFYRNGALIHTSNLFNISQQTGSVSRNMTIHAKYATSPDDITGFYYCALNSSLVTLQSSPVWIHCHEPNNFTTRIVVIFGLLILILFLAFTSFYVYRNCKGGHYRLRRFEERFGLTNRSNSFTDLRKEQKTPFLKFKLDLYSEDDEKDILYHFNNKTIH